ncbi:MAG: hypothetical protein R3F29_00335 [Planctomycetota bacterium]
MVLAPAAVLVGNLQMRSSRWKCRQRSAVKSCVRVADIRIAAPAEADIDWLRDLINALRPC